LHIFTIITLYLLNTKQDKRKMTDAQWRKLLKVIDGQVFDPLPVAFIIDSPWLPNWYGHRIIDYFSNDAVWLNANLKAIKDFPDVMFLPGFWSEYGMCTEPSAFGSRCTFPPNEFPHAHKIVGETIDINSVHSPNPETDGLLPLVLNRLKLNQGKIEEAGHKIRFAVARGPLNIASYLVGMTEFLTMLLLQPEDAEKLVRKVTDLLKSWIDLQRKAFPTIDGIFLLDDIIGFMGEPEFLKFGLPYFQELFDTDVSVKFLHNDAPCRVSAPHLPEMGINLFNMGIDVPLVELQELTQNKITLMGNIPPRDVLAQGTSEDVKKAASEMINSIENKSRILLSCGGGMPPGVSSKNIEAFINAVN
jgi:uroporphyrinogen decarboxylase